MYVNVKREIDYKRKLCQILQISRIFLNVTRNGRPNTCCLLLKADGQTEITGSFQRSDVAEKVGMLKDSITTASFFR